MPQYLAVIGDHVGFGGPCLLGPLVHPFEDDAAAVPFPLHGLKHADDRPSLLFLGQASMVVAVGAVVGVAHAGGDAEFCNHSRVFLMAFHESLQIAAVAKPSLFILIVIEGGFVVHEIGIVGVDVIGTEEPGLVVLSDQQVVDVHRGAIVVLSDFLSVLIALRLMDEVVQRRPVDNRDGVLPTIGCLFVGEQVVAALGEPTFGGSGLFCRTDVPACKAVAAVVDVGLLHLVRFQLSSDEVSKHIGRDVGFIDAVGPSLALGDVRLSMNRIDDVDDFLFERFLISGFEVVVPRRLFLRPDLLQQIDRPILMHSVVEAEGLVELGIEQGVDADGVYTQLAHLLKPVVVQALVLGELGEPASGHGGAKVHAVDEVGLPVPFSVEFKVSAVGPADHPDLAGGCNFTCKGCDDLCLPLQGFLEYGGEHGHVELPGEYPLPGGYSFKQR